MTDADARAALVADPDGSPEGPRLSYVGALDGVRAFAVAAVIAYHAGVTHVTGGFLGVDAFFTLSGFLITSLLLGEARRSGTIALGAFWARRARRLLPCLLLVLCFVGLFSWLAVPQGQYPGLRLDSLATLFYVANWHFILQGSSYFSQVLPLSPLTHTWSLAIEEQFYVVWPIVVLVAVALFRRSAAVVLLVLASAGAIASTLWMRSVAPGRLSDPTRLYYGTDTHAMTILVGAALACALALLARGRDPSTLRATGLLGVAAQAAGAAGAAVLAYLAVSVNFKTHWLYEKGGYLLAGLAAAGILVSVVTAPKGPLAWALSLPPVRYVGRISYGLYLWHYPLFLWLDHAHTGFSGLHLLGVRVVATLCVATASFYLVERPIRHGLVLHGTRAALATIGSVAATIAVILATSLAAALPASGAAPPKIPFHDPVRALLIGDSTALTLGTSLAPWSYLYDVNESDQGLLGCGVTVSDAQVEHGSRLPTNGPCHAEPPAGTTTISELWRHEVASFDPNVVAILAGRWEVHTVLLNGQYVNITQPGFRADVVAGLTEAVQIAGSKGARVVLLTQPCASSGEQPNGQPWPEDSAHRLALYNGVVREVAHRTHSSVLDLDAMVCPHGQYEQVLNGVTVRSPDGVHFALTAGKFLAPRIFSVLLALGREAALAQR